MPIPPGFALARFCHTIAGDNEEMMVTLGVDLGASAGTDQDVADELVTVWEGTMVPGFSSLYTFSRVLVSIGDAPNEPNTVESSSGMAGSGTATPLPNNSAVLVRKVTNSGGRANRGRFYLPGFVAEGDVDAGGNITSGTVSSMQTRLDNLHAALLAVSSPLDGLDPVILHEDALLAPTPVVSFQVQTKLGTQRRRMRP